MSPPTNQMPMTTQTFHVTGLDPRTALCGRSGHIWAAEHWPDDREMRAGLFVRCKECDRLSTPAIETALEDARNLEHAALDAYRNGWREGCGLPPAPAPGEPARTVADHLVEECRELGRRVGAEAAGLVRNARSAENQPPSATLDNATTGAVP